MAKKSKTQRAKASERRAEKKAAALEAIENPTTEVEASSEEKPKKSLFSKSEAKSEPVKKAAKPKKKRFKFLRDVWSEVTHRVTWPSRQDVLQWSGVVVAALLFFGIYVYILDSGIITPLLVAFAGLAG